jgi:UDPglucose 6-dehydrogenase
VKIGWIGLGKLGLPCALALEQHGGHEVIGFDNDDAALEVVRQRTVSPRLEDGLSALLRNTKIRVADSIGQVVRQTDELVFVAVPTPHDAQYGGETLMPPDTRADFNYDAVCQVASALAAAARAQSKKITIVVISTALPGTMEREVLPLLGEHAQLVYNPFFIAMGTTIRDFLHPEFVLLGMRDDTDVTTLIDLYGQLVPGVPLVTIGLREAELAKVAYNTFISMKIVFANTLLEICDKMGANVDHVTKALSFGHRRIVSPAYLRGGMGDGGACHPRDNIAMSWLAERLELSVDLFDFVSRARELQSQWLADEVKALSVDYDLPIIILGKAYKPGSDLTYGSPALLLASQLRADAATVIEHWDPYVDGGELPLMQPAVYVLATQHPDFTDFAFPNGSVVVDPFRYLEHDDTQHSQDSDERPVIIHRLGGGDRGLW